MCNKVGDDRDLDQADISNDRICLEISIGISTRVAGIAEMSGQSPHHNKGCVPASNKPTFILYLLVRCRSTLAPYPRASSMSVPVKYAVSDLVAVNRILANEGSAVAKTSSNAPYLRPAPLPACPA